MALLGFVRMNCVHGGEQLGLALFKVVDRIGIAHKVSAIFYMRMCLMTDLSIA